MTESPPIQVRYDDEADVLYVSIGDPRRAFSETDAEDERVYWRYAMEDDSLCGVTVLDYREWTFDALQSKLAPRIYIPPSILP